MRSLWTATENNPHSPQLEKDWEQQWRPSATKLKKKKEKERKKEHAKNASKILKEKREWETNKGRFPCFLNISKNDPDYVNRHNLNWFLHHNVELWSFQLWICPDGSDVKVSHTGTSVAAEGIVD